MRNLIIFLSTFTLTILIVIFASDPAVAGGASGSWGCPSGWTTKADGSCSFDGGGGGFGGGGSGGSTSPPKTCTFQAGTKVYPTAEAYAQEICASVSQPFTGWNLNNSSNTAGGTPVGANRGTGSPVCGSWGAAGFLTATCTDAPPPPECPKDYTYNYNSLKCEYVPPPEFPDIPPPKQNPDGTPDCNVCQSLYEIKLKLNVLKNQDINNITNIINNMQTTVNNIDNSITSLNVEMNTVNNNLTNINNNMGDLITNITNNNITNNEILNVVNNIDNSMTEYSLKLGDIEFALGDIDVKLDNTNKLVLDLGLDIDFIKNKLVNGSPEGKDYTDQLNEIIELLKPCDPTEEKPCPDDDEVVKKLKEIQDFMQADFVPDTDSTEVEVDDLTDIELDRNLINFGVAQCPPDNEFSTMVNGFSFSGGFKHKPLCDFFSMLSPFVKAFGGFSAALILGGGLRRG